jgi:hypothetical protein
VTKADEHGRFSPRGRGRGVCGATCRVLSATSSPSWLLADAKGYAASAGRAGYLAQADVRARLRLRDAPRAPPLLACASRVVIADGRPASGATVWAIDAQSNPHFDSADQDGCTSSRTCRRTARASCSRATRGWRPPRAQPPLGHVSSPVGTNCRRSSSSTPARARSASSSGRPAAHGSPPRRRTSTAAASRLRRALAPEFMVNNLSLAAGWDETRTDAEGRYEFAGLHPAATRCGRTARARRSPARSPATRTSMLAADESGAMPDLVVGACFTLEGRSTAARSAGGARARRARSRERRRARARAPGSRRHVPLRPLSRARSRVVLLHGADGARPRRREPDERERAFLRRAEEEEKRRRTAEIRRTRRSAEKDEELGPPDRRVPAS